ncbi:MAG: RNA degradosome polyphosphate kinase [Acidimicrobiales bacterium]
MATRVRAGAAAHSDGSIGVPPGAGVIAGAGRVSKGAPGNERLLNRELSWLDFSAKLLELAEDSKIPLLERVKFLAIFSQGLDEFFQVRVAGLLDQVDAGLRNRSPDGLTPAEQLRAIRERVLALVAWQGRICSEQVLAGLCSAGVSIVDRSDLDEADRSYLAEVFEARIFPVLTPLAVDPSHPFPYISNLSLNLAVMVADPVTGEQRFARVKVPPLLPRFVAMPDGVRLVPLEQVIAAHLDSLFPRMTIGSHHAFRVTRNADLVVEEDEADDLLAALETELRRRRFGRAVRLEVDEAMGQDVRDLLARELEITAESIYDCSAPVDLGGLWAVYAIDRPDLHEEPWAPMTQPRLATPGDEPVDLFAVLRERDVLVHHPYDSFATSVEAFIAQAAADPAVLAIKQTLYRTSGDSPIVGSLISAAEAGKQVVAVVEVKARFDEQANIHWGRALEEAGVHVVYGLVGLKTHSKAALVVRREDDIVRRYVHLGTGNYNSKTARMYEDLGLLSASEELGQDLGDLFNFLTGYSRHETYRKLIVAPQSLRERVVRLIDEEARAGTEGRIVIKVNGLTDPEVIEHLYSASDAGVDIDLVVRGICCLRPGVRGLSERIKVRSIVGRFLEHSRVFRFGGVGGRPLELLIGSADLMERNLDRRVELLVPISDREIQDRIVEMLELNLAEDYQAWTLGPDGSWSRVASLNGISTQRRLQEMARERARRRREADTLGTGTS